MKIYKLATIVEGDPKVLFSIATTRCREGSYSFPWMNVKQGGTKYHFKKIYTPPPISTFHLKTSWIFF